MNAVDITNITIIKAQESSKREIEQRTRRVFNPETGIQSTYLDGKLVGTKQVRVTYVSRKDVNDASSKSRDPRGPL
jgi:hypothetical protein